MPPYFIPVLLITVVVILIGTGPMVARLGVWSTLAKVYPAPGPFKGKILLGSGRMGIVNYGFSLQLGADSEGLSLKAVNFIKTGHAPLYIPWKDISAREVEGPFYKRVLVNFQKAPGVVLGMPKSIIIKLKEMTGIPQVFPEIV